LNFQPPVIEYDPSPESVRRAFQYKEPVLAPPESPQQEANEAGGGLPVGRIVAGLALLSVLALGAYNVWDACFRYWAHGVVTATMIHVTPPLEGTIENVAIHEGEFVREGQVLATLHNLQLEHQLARVRDELKVATSELSAQHSRLALEADIRRLESQLATAELHDARRTRAIDETEYEKLKNELDRARALSQRGAVNTSDLELAEINEKGQRAQVAAAVESSDILRERAAQAIEVARKDSKQLEPTIGRIEGLKAEIKRLELELAQTQLVSPATGILVKQHRFQGERIRTNQALFTIDVADSMQVELYLTQKWAGSLKTGDVVHVLARPYADSLPCTVLRVGTRHVPPPESLQRQYPPDTTLLPVYLQPNTEFLEGKTLRPGATVKLSRSWFGG